MFLKMAFLLLLIYSEYTFLNKSHVFILVISSKWQIKEIYHFLFLILLLCISRRLSGRSSSSICLLRFYYLETVNCYIFFVFQSYLYIFEIGRKSSNVDIGITTDSKCTRKVLQYDTNVWRRIMRVENVETYTCKIPIASS